MESATVDSPLRRNPVFWIVWLIPAATVVAGLSTLAVALRSADRPLPEAYHWEGEHLDRDFALARNAAIHGIQVTLTANAADGICTASVRAAPLDAPALTLLFANGADAGLDRVVLLKRVAAGEYRGPCAPIPPGRWRVALEDSAGQWSIRTQLVGSVHQLTLRARRPEGEQADGKS
jgi:hypothetical protein